MQFVDTNIFIRFLTKDDIKKAEKCFLLLESANRGNVKLQTTESVISEIVYILSSKKLFNLNRKEISEKLKPLIKIYGLKITSKKTLVAALDLYSNYNIDFEDAILVANMIKVGSKVIYSYDRGFDKIPYLKRLEP